MSSGRKRSRAAASTSASASASLFQPPPPPPRSHALLGCTAVCARLASSSVSARRGAAAGFVDLLLQLDPSTARQLLVYSFGKPLTAADLSAIFERAGALEVAWRDELPPDPATGSSLHCAAVLFEDAVAARRALRTPSAFPAADGEAHALGLKGLLDALGSQRQDARQLQLGVDSFMSDFERAEGKAAEAKVAFAQAMDADGFTVVRARGVAGAEVFESDNQRRKRARGSILAADFYRFQKRDAKHERLADLRSKFDEDKARIRKMKEARTFKPY